MPDPPAAHQATADFVRRGRLDPELDHAVVHPDLVAGAQVSQVFGMRDRRPLGGPFHRMRAQGERPAGLEVDAGATAGADRPEPDLRALQVLEDGDRSAPARLAVADATNDIRVLVVRAVGEIEARHVEAGRHEAIALLGAAARPTARAD